MKRVKKNMNSSNENVKTGVRKYLVNERVFREINRKMKNKKRDRTMS